MNDPLIGPIERFLARLNGPMNVRFIVQPVMAISAFDPPGLST